MTLALGVALTLGCTRNDAGVDAIDEADTEVVGSDPAVVDDVDAEAERVEADAADIANDPPANPAVERRAGH
jgi:hypothetical protein